MTLTQTDIQAIKKALEPEFTTIKEEFAKVRSEAKQNFTTLNKKIDSLKRSNRKDHNIIIHAGFPPYKSLV